jgi:K+-sensing histidine kinase KdpD
VHRVIAGDSDAFMNNVKLTLIVAATEEDRLLSLARRRWVVLCPECAAMIALAIFLLATLLTFPLGRFVVHSRDLLLVAAIVVVSRIAGATAGLVASFAAVLLFDWFFDRAPQVLGFSVGGAARALVFCSISVLVASMEQPRHCAMERLEKSNRALQAALKEIKTLRGLLPICSYCKRIEADEETWIEIEEYVRKHTRKFQSWHVPHLLSKELSRTLQPEI